MNLSVDAVLGAGGTIAQRLAGFEERPQQLELARAVEQALAGRRTLVAEAGTGVGKSFAYLLPAVVHACAHAQDGPVVVSTRTIALQQQLERKDLPFLQQILPLEWSAVTAVGRGNYLCLRRMHLAHLERQSLFRDVAHEQQIAQIVEWSLATREGTRMDVPFPLDERVWDEVRAEHGNCLNRACKHYDPCHWQRARRRMDRAQILVVNHALYFADVALRIAGARYLPPHRVVVFDEAHHLERVATESLGLRLARTALHWHLRRLHAREDKSLLVRCGAHAAIRLVQELRARADEFFADLDGRLERAGTGQVALGEEALADPLGERLAALASVLEEASTRLEELDLRMELLARAQGVGVLGATVHALCAGQAAGHVRWLERTKHGAELRSAPLSVRDTLREHVFKPETSAVLVSATLGPAGDDGFQWLRGQLGIDHATTLRAGSPFDYGRQMQLVLEEALPDPARDPEGFERAAIARIEQLVLENHGHALVLCTSWSFVRSVAAALQQPLAAAGIPLLVQGEGPLARQLERKQEEPASVLVGTDSLWEGIDVPGEALTLVIVAKLPFAQPGHPLLQARLRAIEQRGGNGFAELTLPEAVLKLRQGFGRLIRSHADHGKVVILDPRVRTKGYGRLFLESLPAGPRDGSDPGLA